MKCSIIIAVLESYEVVRRTLLYYNTFLHSYPDFEFILVDDGSEPALEAPIELRFPFTMIQTNDKRPWTQPCARNAGAQYSSAEYLLMTDIDHFFTEECIKDVQEFKGDKMHFARDWGTLDERGNLDLSEKSLAHYAPTLKNNNLNHSHYNTFAIRREIFEMLKGYDPKFCGKYGGDDVDFSKRYSVLHYDKHTKPSNGQPVQRSVGGRGRMFVWPDPKWDRQKIFHHLRWEK